MDKEALKAAMGKRRGQGVNLNIIIGGDEPEEEKLKDLAPEVTDRPEGELGSDGESPEHPDAAQDEALFQRMLEEMGGQLPMANKLKSKKVIDGQELG